MISEDGYRSYPPHPETAVWAAEALRVAREVAADPQERARHLRHDGTWFVGVDALPTGAWGVLGDVPIGGAFGTDLSPVKTWVKGQLSIIYPGYPGRDPGESDGAHRYRLLRGAAHVDGLKAEGEGRRRFARELHAFILGVPLTNVTQAPTLAWPGSHRIIGEALREAIGDAPPTEVDVTEAYVAARQQVLERICPVPLSPPPGGAFLLHRLLVHGTAPWEDDGAVAPDGRMVVFFRPEVARPEQWLARDWD